MVRSGRSRCRSIPRRAERPQGEPGANESLYLGTRLTLKLNGLLWSNKLNGEIMMKSICVGDIRRAIEGLPDDAPIIIDGTYDKYYLFECVGNKTGNNEQTHPYLELFISAEDDAE